MWVYIWKEWTPTSYDIEDIIADMPSSYPSGRLWSFVIDYEMITVVGEHGTWNISMYWDGSWNVSFESDAYHLLNMYFYNWDSIRIGLDSQYSYRTVLSHSGTITLDMDNKTYSIDVTVILDWDEAVPLQTSWSFTWDDIWVVNRLMGTSYQATFTWDVTLITWWWETPLSSAHIWEPVRESYIVDLTTTFSANIPSWESISKLHYIFDITNNVQFYWQLNIGSDGVNLAWSWLGFAWWVWLSIPDNQLQWTFTYDFWTGIATWDLVNWSWQTESWSRWFSWSLDTTQNIPITWAPPSWWDVPTGTVEIRVER